MDIDVLLSEKFVEFSTAIADIFNEKKKRKEEFKKLYDQYQADIREIEARAASLSEEFENWKNSLNEEKA